MSIDLTPSEREHIVESIIDRAWEHQRETIEELTLISVSRFAGMVDLSTPQARKVLAETIDFGAQNTRVSLAEARRVIESRRVRRK